MAQIEINQKNFWLIDCFIGNYKAGYYGLIPLSEAIEKYFYEFMLLYEEKEEND